MMKTEMIMIYIRIIAVFCFFVCSSTRASVYNVSGTFASPNVGPFIPGNAPVIPGNAWSGSFAFQADFGTITGTGTEIVSPVPGTLSVTLTPDTFGGVTFSVANGNIGAGIRFVDGQPDYISVGGILDGLFYATHSGDAFTDFLVTYEIVSAGTAEIRLVVADTSTGSAGGFSTMPTGIATYSPVPEPASLGLLGLAILPLIARQIRR